MSESDYSGDVETTFQATPAILRTLHPERDDDVGAYTEEDIARGRAGAQLALSMQTEDDDVTAIRPHLMLTDKVVIHALLSAWVMNNGTVLHSAVMETIQELAGLTNRHFVQLPLSTDTSMVKLTSFLKGYLLSGGWTAFSVG